MSRFSIEAVFSAVDRMTGPVKRMTGNTTTFSKTVRRDFAKAQRSVENFNRSIRSKMGQAVKVGATTSLAALGIATGLVIREFLEFDQAIISAGAKFKDLDTSTEAGRKALEELRKTARKVGAETQFSATQAGQGLDYLAMAGFTSAQAMKLLPGVVNIATIANVELGRATDIASDALGAFGLATKNTTQLGINFTRLQDVMAKTITSTNVNMEDLFETIKFGAPAFTSAGQSMETFNAIAGRMASSGIKGSMAGTALRSAINRLQKPTKEVRKGLEALGLSQEKITDPKTGKLLDMVKIMKLMETGGKKLTTVERNAALARIVGLNAMSAWSAVMNEGVGQTEKLKESLLKANGAAAKMAAEIRKSLINRLKGLQSAAVELGFKFMVAFEKQGGKAIDKLTKAVREFDPTPIISGMKTVWKILSVTIDVIDELKPAIGALAVIWGIYKAALVVAAIKQGILNGAMYANPAFLVVAGIILLIAAIVILWKKWDILSDKVKIFIAIGATLLFGPIGGLVIGFIELAKRAGGFMNAIKVLGKVMVQALLYPVNLVIDGLSRFIGAMSKIPGLGGKFKGAVSELKGFQNKMNKTFEITEFDKEASRKKNAFFNTVTHQKPAPVTQRESVFQSFRSEIMEKVNVNVQNGSSNPVSVNRSRDGRKSSLFLPASGTP